ncbi:hypothetical protein GN956_G25558 [Arapaima gigas]
MPRSLSRIYERWVAKGVAQLHAGHSKTPIHPSTDILILKQYNPLVLPWRQEEEPAKNNQCELNSKQTFLLRGLRTTKKC